jgi:glycosyltransferase involved in cell wall biosynthesis
MKVCYVSTFYPEKVPTPAAMLEHWPLLRSLPPALVDAGHQVVVLAHAGVPATQSIGGAGYVFIDPGNVAHTSARLLDHWKPRHGPAYYLPATRLVRELRRQRPDLVHFAGLTLDLQLAQVARACSRLAVPLVVHYHGGEPDQGRIRHLQRHNAAQVSRVLVTTLQQAEPWIASRLFEPDQFRQVVESSSPFSGIGRDAARARTGMAGDPVYLSAGRLDAIKDPLTTLRGFERIASSQPDARLYLYYLTAELLPAVTAFLSERPALAERIELRGKAPLAEMESIYSSADFLLQASLREWSGLAVIEAMSCGCIPIVSDIPSFQMLTNRGEFGRLFVKGDPEDLERAALSIAQSERSHLSQAIREHFHRELSFAAMARQIDTVYRDLRPDLAKSNKDRAPADVFGSG